MPKTSANPPPIPLNPKIILQEVKRDFAQQGGKLNELGAPVWENFSESVDKIMWKQASIYDIARAFYFFVDWDSASIDEKITLIQFYCRYMLMKEGSTSEVSLLGRYSLTDTSALSNEEKESFIQDFTSTMQVWGWYRGSQS